MSVQSPGSSESKKLIRESRSRWDAVAAIETAEQRAATLALRWQQLNAISGLLMALGVALAETDRQEDAVRQRFAKLREALQ